MDTCLPRTEMSINFGISGWSSLRKLRQVVNAHLSQHFILPILPVVLQCASNPVHVLLEIINLGSEEKGKVHKKLTHTQQCIQRSGSG